ncbi:DUF397 domain-containing protein [Streptomyces sp. 150FB]|uniref:DUF397 domain-containing protein n=1 Tax=Streptomyces sp. 150FB TaxID=1576605 RepID=UPI00099CB3ED|nr:DUF397 domain-containing protein [Streptomyces sp. 150FB]
MSMADLSRVEWVKSTYSGSNGGECVEFSHTLLSSSGVVPVRDSKVPAGPVLMLAPGAWTGFVAFAAAQGARR